MTEPRERLSLDEVAVLTERVRLLEFAVVDYAERFGLTDLARSAMIVEQSSTSDCRRQNN